MLRDLIDVWERRFVPFYPDVCLVYPSLPTLFFSLLTLSSPVLSLCITELMFILLFHCDHFSLPLSCVFRFWCSWWSSSMNEWSVPLKFSSVWDNIRWWSWWSSSLRMAEKKKGNPPDHWWLSSFTLLEYQQLMSKMTRVKDEGYPNTICSWLVLPFLMVLSFLSMCSDVVVDDHQGLNEWDLTEGDQHQSIQSHFLLGSEGERSERWIGRMIWFHSIASSTLSLYFWDHSTEDTQMILLKR